MIDLHSMVILDIRILIYSGPLATSSVEEPLLISSLNLSPLRVHSLLIEAWMNDSICTGIWAFCSPPIYWWNL